MTQQVLLAPSERITIDKLPGGGYVVSWKDRKAEELTADEALGSVASILFSGFRPGIFLRTKEQNNHINQAYKIRELQLDK